MQKKLLPLLVLLLLCVGMTRGQEILPDSSATSKARSTQMDTTYSPKYKHSVGVNFSMYNGISLKLNLKDNVYLQMDMGLDGGVSPMMFVHPIFGPLLYIGYGGHVCVYAEDLFPKRTNTYWIAGGGAGYSGCITSFPEYGGSKVGINAILGIEWKFDIPLSLQLDFRPGCSVLLPPTRKMEYSHIEDPWFYLDYAFVFSLRYNFGIKK